MSVSPFGWIAAGGLFVWICAVILSSPIVAKASLRRFGENDDADLKIKALFGLIKYEMKIPIMQFTGSSVKLKEETETSGAGFDTWKQYNDEIDADKVASFIDKYKQTLHLIRNLKGWLRGTLSRVHMTEWRWSTTVGTGDAMWTAMATGLVWSLKTSIVGVISQIVQLEAEPQMQVVPNYRNPAFTTEWSCIAQIRFGYAILAGLQLLVRMKKWKGGVKAWQNILSRA